MSPIITIGLLFFTALLPFLISLTAFNYFYIQFIALFTIIFIIYWFRTRRLNLFLISFIVTTLIFSTGGLNSPFYFLVYFLLFTLAFEHHALVTLSFSLTLIFFLSQSLNSFSSLIPLFSLVLVTPLAWFVSRQYLDNLKLTSSLAADETEVFLWLSLKLKNALVDIIDCASLLLSQPRLGVRELSSVHRIQDTAKFLLKSSQKLTHEIEDNDN